MRIFEDNSIFVFKISFFSILYFWFRSIKKLFTKLIKNPQGELKINVGDYLIIILSGKAFKLWKKIFGVEEGAVKERK